MLRVHSFWKLCGTLPLHRHGLPHMLTFANPPLNEVVLGQNFLVRPDFLVPMFGEFWLSIRDQYPKCAHAAPLAQPGEAPVVDQTSGAWLPRIWFISEDDSRLVQLQQDRLYVNWRQMPNGGPYKRFPGVKSEFDRIWGLFEQYLVRTTGQKLSPTRLELTYINIIPQGEGWQHVAGFGNVLRDFQWGRGDRFLPEPQRYAGQFEFSVAQDLSLLIKVGSGKRVSDQKEVLRLELAAYGTPESRSRDDWIQAAREVIVKGFKDITTPTMHVDHWHLEE